MDNENISAIKYISNENYVSLVTFKKDGTPVATPICIAQLRDHASVVTGGQSFKVKRIKNNPKATLTPCTRNGSLISDKPLPVICKISDDQNEIKQYNKILVKKYGFMAKTFLIFEKLTFMEKRNGKNVIIHFIES